MKVLIAPLLASVLLLGAAAAAQPPPAETSAFILKGIAVKGNKLLKDGAVRDMLVLEKGQRYDRYLFDYMLERGLSAVKQAYYAEGYHQTTVKWSFRDVKADSRKLEIRVREGPRARVKDILIVGVETSDYLAVREGLGMDVGSPLAASKVTDAAATITAYFANRGYAYVKVTPEIDHEAAVVTFVVETGRIYYIGKTIVAGNERTRPRIITREVDYAFRKNRLYNAGKLDKVRGRIFASGLYRDLRLEPVDVPEKPDEVNLVAFVREDKFRYYKLEPGYESPDRGQLTVEWGHYNLFGNNQRLAVTASGAYAFLDKYAEYSSDVTYTEPWLFGYRYKGSARLFYEKIERVWQAGLEPRVARDVTDKLELAVSMTFSRVREANQRSNVPLRNITSITEAATYNGRDDIFNPLKGIYLFGSEETAGGILGGTDFWRVIGDARNYVPVGPAGTMAARVRMGYEKPYSDTLAVPSIERFYAGGAFTIRGYGEREVGPKNAYGEPLGGDVLIVGNAELRFQIPFTEGHRIPGIGLNLGNLWGGLFLDAGNVWKEWADLRKGGTVYGVGAGLRYNTPVGPLRFDYGQPVAERRAGPGRLYFAFGHIF